MSWYRNIHVHIYHPQTKLRESNVFTGSCPFIGGLPSNNAMGKADPPSPIGATGGRYNAYLLSNKFHSTIWPQGAGTAIGELPPYFMARAARLSGQIDEEEQELEELLLEKKEHPGELVRNLPRNDRQILTPVFHNVNLGRISIKRWFFCFV